MMDQYGTDQASVYYAELIYYPFSSGCYTMDFNFDPKMVPIWALYYYVGNEDPETVSSGAIFLDAVDGHCLSVVS